MAAKSERKQATALRPSFTPGPYGNSSRLLAGDPFANLSLYDLFEAPGDVVGTDTGLVTQGGVADPALAAFLSNYAGQVLRFRVGQAESSFPWNT